MQRLIEALNRQTQAIGQLVGVITELLADEIEEDADVLASKPYLSGAPRAG